MADGSHLEKWKIDYTLKTDHPIITKFGMVNDAQTLFEPFFLNSRLRRAPMLKNKKWPHFNNGLIDKQESLHDGAHCVRTVLAVKIYVFYKFKKADGSHLHNDK